MIRRLEKNDHELCFKLLKTKPAENLFIIGDIEGYGCETDFQKVWGEFSDDGELKAVLLKYEENFIPFALGDFDAEGFAQIIMNEPDFSMLSGIKDVTAKIEPHINHKLTSKRQLYYAKCTSLIPETTDLDTSKVKQAYPDDAERLVDLMKATPEFSDSTLSVERKRRRLQDGVSRSFFLEEEGLVVSSASTDAENSLSAMVVGVATLGTHKKKGYATQCMVKLCNQLLNEGKELCLFYDNPEAGAIYKRIGFEDIGLWMMYSYKRD